MNPQFQTPRRKDKIFFYKKKGHVETFYLHSDSELGFSEWDDQLIEQEFDFDVETAQKEIDWARDNLQFNLQREIDRFKSSRLKNRMTKK